MAEYIDRKAVKELIYRRADGYSYIEMPTESLIKKIDEIPTADVVEVVRCKDCWYWGSTLTPEEIEEARTDPNSDLVCDMWMSDGFSLDDYCSCGKRRSDGN